jgi:hypothetical protein
MYDGFADMASWQTLKVQRFQLGVQVARVRPSLFSHGNRQYRSVFPLIDTASFPAAMFTQGLGADTRGVATFI